MEYSSQKQLMFQLVQSPNCMSDFSKTIETLANDKQHKVFTGQLDKTKCEVKAYWICGLDYSSQEIEMLGHCHYSDNFLIWSHKSNNLKRR